MTQKLHFYEFFAGGGMARQGLRNGWKCTFANDFDRKKCQTYRENWGDEDLFPGDVGAVSTADLPERCDLAWASSPCQDFSLAGNGAGLNGLKSNVFWSFWRLITELAEERRKPRAIVLENVRGLLTSRDGRDFETICRALAIENYHIGGFVIDASHFVPQSRPRVFLIGFLEGECRLPDGGTANDMWHPNVMQNAVASFPSFLNERWNWWDLPNPPKRNADLADILEGDVSWHSADKTQQLLELMNVTNRTKIEDRIGDNNCAIGAAFRRTRVENGRRRQRIEVRFDGMAGCLRTPGGGSSRQTIFSVGQGEVKSRLLTPRETARLMGLSDDYILPANPNDAFQLSGDGVAVPVVEFLSQHVLMPALKRDMDGAQAAWQKNQNLAKV
ncbi:DNA cytosine methyltransferase [Altererythrobacter sp. MTPC7]|uniref:DNA cytosine methyltransferase n=1 Tax=Altererythrobacter sp. MTPC7 TaxID=3056567 RepID=UPI0036F20D7D